MTPEETSVFLRSIAGVLREELDKLDGRIKALEGGGDVHRGSSALSEKELALMESIAASTAKFVAARIGPLLSRIAELEATLGIQTKRGNGTADAPSIALPQ